ncbi:MAG: hypothetical protein WAS34_18925 [Thiolinea sp.]
MKEIEMLIKRESAMAKQNLLYQLLGKFGDTLPKEIEESIRTMAEEEGEIYISLGLKVLNRMS